MDPDAAIIALRRLIRSRDEQDRRTMREYVEGLGQWLERGGFRPSERAFTLELVTW